MQRPVVSQLAKILVSSLLLILGIFFPLTLAQQIGHSLRGKVYLPGNNTTAPNPPVRVQLLSKGSLQAETFTDSSGAFNFGPLVNGNYQLVVQSDGLRFSTTITEVQIFFMSGNRVPQIVTQDISLTAKPSDIGSIPNATLADRQLDASIPKEAKKAYEKGSKSAKKGNMPEALEYLNQAIGLYPKYFDAHMALGELHAKAKDLTSAESAFLQAIEIKPKSAEAKFHLGVILIKTGKSNEAIEKLRQAIELGDASANTHLFLGVALMNTKNFEESEKMLVKALDIGGNLQPSIRIYLADCYERWGKTDKTIEQLEAYVRQAPTAPNVADIERAIKQLKEKR
ncbi:MAG: tetratricopeptide repeat protein [Acidobacteria bacterium]|nr:tetratricopeptide repeat protein [Acidobacteriota bacterium]